MKLSKSVTNRGTEKPKRIDRFTYIVNANNKLVVPVGRRFQAEVPPFTPPASRHCPTTGDSKSCDSKWAGTQIWPPKGRSQDANNKMIGRGRSDICECLFPGSIKCVKKHISEERVRLKIDLGIAFWKWKFDEMGEDVSKFWNPQDQKNFEFMVRMHAKSSEKSFIDSARECFPGKSRSSIVSYYLNVYLPRRITTQTRSSYVTIDTDDEGEDTVCLKGGRKRLQANNFTSNSCKYVRKAYLTANR